eukprot:CAMPEP_0198564532 /NCGR_PEP_ID=MMETSP1462-20131121/100425_1 /TAXON_ID=1333877 /ORGANISM="Brandtodinium nutriculum, Strain RCC3387" /LENGTH=38 /DNA_ID= /DNA_START= /DNA_END= /DNA_ORIENTATION=
MAYSPLCLMQASVAVALRGHPTHAERPSIPPAATTSAE